MKTPQKTQQQHFYSAVENAARANKQFLEFVKNGLKREELERLIAKRPSLWGRFKNWLPNLPLESN